MVRISIEIDDATNTRNTQLLNWVEAFRIPDRFFLQKIVQILGIELLSTIVVMGWKRVVQKERVQISGDPNLTSVCGRKVHRPDCLLVPNDINLNRAFRKFDVVPQLSYITSIVWGCRTVFYHCHKGL